MSGRCDFISCSVRLEVSFGFEALAVHALKSLDAFWTINDILVMFCMTRSSFK